MIKVFSLFLTTILITGCASPITDFVVPQGVRKEAAAVASFATPKESLVEAKAKMDARLTGNLGIVWHFSQILQTRTTADGLTDDLTVTEASDGRNHPTSTMRTLSVCGLVPLLSEAARGGLAGQLHFIPTNKSVNVVSTGSAMPMSNKVRINAFKTDTNSMCNPTPGMTFTFQVSGHAEQAGHGPIGTVRRVDEFTDTVTCTNERLDANLVNLEQFGATLLTKCKNKSATEYRFQPIELNFVFLPKVGRYLQIFRKAPGVEEKFEYTTLKFSSKQ